MVNRCAMLFLIATLTSSTIYSQQRDGGQSLAVPMNDHPEIVVKQKSNVVPLDTPLDKEIARRLAVANFHFAQGNYKASAALFNNVLESRPNSAEAMFGLAESQEKLGKMDEAKRQYEACSKVAPNSPYGGLSRIAIKRLEGQSTR